MTGRLPELKSNWGRLLNAEQMRIYCGRITEDKLNAWMDQELLPKPRRELNSGYRYWDRWEVDEYLDRLFGRAKHGRIGQKFKARHDKDRNAVS